MRPPGLVAGVATGMVCEVVGGVLVDAVMTQPSLSVGGSVRPPLRHTFVPSTRYCQR